MLSGELVSVMFRIFRFYLFQLLFFNFYFPVLQLCCRPSNLGQIILVKPVWLKPGCFHWIDSLGRSGHCMYVSGQHRRLFLTEAFGMLLLFLCSYDESCLHSRVCPAFFRLAHGKELGVRLGLFGTRVRVARHVL